MKLEATYKGASAIVNELSSSRVAFATNTLRETTFFEGELGDPLAFREGLAALNAVVVSDFKYRPKDRLAFNAWLEDQDRKFLANLGVKGAKIQVRIRELEARVAELDAARLVRRRPFHDARLRYFDYVYLHQYELKFLLDPVITVHPDELSFEAFSRDESSYARLAVRYDLFSSVQSFECGTTNIDFSARLARELDRMRSYRETRFKIDPSGFTVQTGDAPIHKEKKIDLPDSWVMGFLQVHSVLTMGLTHFRMAAVDLFNIVRQLKRRKARTSPRALRYELVPGERIRVVLEPWEQVIPLSETAIWDGDKPLTFRTWGRDRLTTLARLIPVASSIDVYLAGFGLPSVYVVDLGRLTFTLALSGWTDNDWSGEGSSQFDLLNRQLTVTEAQLAAVHAALREQKFGTAPSIASTAKLDVEKTRSALGYLCQTGRCMFDLAQGVFRFRELFLTPFEPKGVVAAAEKAAEKSDPRATMARAIFERGDVRIIAVRPVPGGFKLSGSARGNSGDRTRPLMEIDQGGKIVTATCTCSFFNSHQLTLGPCEHILALRLAHMARFDGKKENQ